MANKYKYVCTVSALFRAARAFVRGPAQRISCMSGTRYRSPDSRPSAGGTRARGHGHGRGGALANQGGTAACLLCRGRKGYALGRAGCWRIRVGRRCPGLPKTRGACLPDKAGVCLSGSREGSRMPIRVSAGPKAEVRTNAGSAFGRMPGLPGYAWVSHPNRAVGLPERGACCGYGRSAVLAARKK